MLRNSRYLLLLSHLAIGLCFLAPVLAQESAPERTARAVALLKRADAASSKIGEPDGGASAYWSIGALLVENGAKEEAVKVLEKARARAFEVKDRVRRWELIEIISREEMLAGAPVNTEIYAARAENDAQKSAVVSSIAAGLFEAKHPKQARELFEQAWKLAAGVTGPYKEVFLLSLADEASSAGDTETAREFYKRFRDYVRKLGGESEILGLRKLGEAQLEAKLPGDALKTFQDAAGIAIAGNSSEGVGEIVGLMVSGGLTREADVIVARYSKILDKIESAGERTAQQALLADTLNREAAFPMRVLQLIEKVSAVDQAYLLPEAVMNLASAGKQAKAADYLPRITVADDQVSVMCAISDAWIKAGDKAQGASWVARALATARTIDEEDIRRESMLEVAEQQVASGLTEDANKTWKEVANAGPEFRRAIQERQFFQLVEAKQWEQATAALKAMADSPDVIVLQTGLAAELAKNGELARAMTLVKEIPKSNSAHLEIIRLAYEKHGSILAADAFEAVLESQSDPEIIVSLIIGHVGGFRRESK